MIKSMTGFGRSEIVTSEYKVSVEIKSVNHRYCDLSIKMPKKFNAYENDIRNMLKKYASRGKIDVYINYSDYADKNTVVRYHSNVAKGYMDAIENVSDEFGVDRDISAIQLIRMADVISLEDEEQEDDNISEVIFQAVADAGEQFVLAREKEGSSLKNDILLKLTKISELVAKVEERSPDIVTEYRKKITEKVEELLGDRKLDEAVLATEITLFADKICVDEETVRLHSHIKNMRDSLEYTEAIGRKLDFIAQEMNREANTILSKANDMELSEYAIDLKTEIEKIREQIQNIE